MSRPGNRSCRTGEVMNRNVWICIGKAGNNYDAYAPEVPGCITTGHTIEKTKENMLEALTLFFEDDANAVDVKGDFPYADALEAKANGEEEYYYLVQVRMPEEVEA